MLLTGAGAGHRGLRLQGVGGAVPPVDARRLRGGPHAGHRVHGDGDQGRRAGRSCCASSTSPLTLVDAWETRSWPLAAITIIVGNVAALQPGLAEAHARLLRRRSGRVHADRQSSSARSAASEATVLYYLVVVPVHEPGRVRRRDRAVERERADGDGFRRCAGTGRTNPWMASADDDRDAVACRHPGHCRLHRQVPADPRAVDGSYTWLAIVLVIGSMISLGYYLRVIATLWMRDPVPAPGPGVGEPFMARGGLAPIAGGSPEADAENAAGRITRGAAVEHRHSGRHTRDHGGGRAVRRRQRGLRDLPAAAVRPRRPRRAARSDWAKARRRGGRQTPQTRSTGRKPTDS